MKASRVMWSLGLAATVFVAGQRSAIAADAAPAKEISSFGLIKAPAVETVRGQAQDWLKTVGKTDEASQQKFDAIWKNDDQTTLEKLTETFVLGSADAAKLMTEARNPTGPAPKELPTVLRDAKNQPAFLRANLGLAYAKALSNRRIYEDGLEALKGVKVDQVVDPAAFYFTKAVAEHALQNREEATKSIGKLLDDVSDAPERYKMVAALMFFDMATWQDKGLGKIGQLMGTVERRLEVARGGPITIKVEQEIIRRLEEEIKKLESQAGGGGGGAGGCPAGGKPGDGMPGDKNNPSNPQKDSYGGQNTGPGKVNPKDFENKAAWIAKLPEKDRAKAIQDSVRGLPPGSRKIVEDYFKKVASESGAK